MKRNGFKIVALSHFLLLIQKQSHSGINFWPSIAVICQGYLLRPCSSHQTLQEFYFLPLTIFFIFCGLLIMLSV